MTPVEQINTFSFSTFKAFPTIFANFSFASSPSFPVQALAIPLLIAIAFTVSLFSTTCLSHKTGAAFTIFVVKVPTAFASTSETIKAKSLFFFLIPICNPAPLYPFGLVTVPSSIIFILFFPL